MSEEVKMEREDLVLVTVHEANSSQIVKLMDDCNTKEEFKTIEKTCKNMFKEFKKYRKVKNSKIFLVFETEINKDIIVKTIIQNYSPEIVDLDTKPLEIWTKIETDAFDALSTKGSGYYGGCNISEYREFLAILKDSVKYFDNI